MWWLARVELSVEGLWGAWSIVVKGTLGVLASIVLTSTTEVTDILEGLDRLRVPRVFTDIAGFMVRYLDVILGEQRRMRVAMLSRGYDPGWWWQARALAASAGSMFIRSYERGERVFFAMTSRGYQGHMPRFSRHRATYPILGRSTRPPCAGGDGGAGRGDLAAGPTMSTPALEVAGLNYRYPDGTEVLRDVGFHIHPGERVALLGPNGAGKTTLVLHLNGIIEPDSGTVRVAGLPVTPEHLMEIRRRTGVVFQDPDDQLFMPTVWKDVAFGPANYGLEGDALDARVMAALDAVGMTDVARSTTAPPQPGPAAPGGGGDRAGDGAGDPGARRAHFQPRPGKPARLASVLTSLDITMLMVTHDLPYALELCPRSLVINDGRIVADGPTADVLADADLMRANRLELPFGFDPRVAVPRPG